MKDGASNGLRLAGIGLAIFVIGGIFFELVIGINGFPFASVWMCWPILLIGLGIFMLISSLLPRRSSSFA